MIPLVTPSNEQDLHTFEQTFAAHMGTEWAIAVSSGTTALQLAIHALGLNGRKLRIPTYACTALLRATNGRATFVDSHWDTRTAKMNQDQADIAVHMFGTWTFPKHAPIEDHTLSLGQHIPLEGDLGVCSTHASKMISTGRGGMVFGNNLNLKQRVTDLAQDVRMSPAQAALGLEQLQQLDLHIAKRQQLARTYTLAFNKAGITCPQQGGVFFRYIIKVDDPAAKVLELAKHGIEAGRGVHPLLHQTVGQPDDKYPGAVHAHNTNLSIPIHPAITNAQAKHIVEQVIRTCT